MKKIFITILALIAFAFAATAQEFPDGFNYQAVVRNAANQLVRNQEITVRISILAESNVGTPIFTKTYEHVRTNYNGLFTLSIGESSEFDNIDWTRGKYFIKSEIRLNDEPEDQFRLSTVQRIWAVPYAWYSRNSIRSEHANTADNASHANSADEANHANSANNANHANSADYANNAGHANTADSANYADNAGNANHANSADYANNAGHANTADSANYAGNAGNANHANSADYADNAGHANNADSANYAGNAGNANYATESGHALVADSVSGGINFTETDPIFTAWDKDYYDLINRPTRLSQFINDLNFLTAGDLNFYVSGDTLYYNGGYVVLPANGNNLTSIEWDSVINHPTNLSQFVNDLGFITEETQGLSDVIARNNNANGQIKNLSTPTEPMDAVNKLYADSILADGLNTVNNRINNVNDNLNDRIDSLDNALQNRIDNLEGRVDTLYAWFLAHRDSMNGVIADLNTLINNVNNNLQNQLAQANNRIYQLEHPTVDGALNGIFSVSANTKINFSKGNLQYRPRIKTWRFAAHQYDVAGNDNNLVYMQNYCTNWIDLFGFGTSGWDGGAGRYMPYETSTNDAEYRETTNDNGSDLTDFYANADWGFYNPIINGGNQTGMWRTLTYAEWTYLLTQRPNAANLKGMATVASTPGYVILPDTWECPAGYTFANTDTSYTINVYSAADWAVMEAAGAVFLPAAGSRTGSVTSNVGVIGNYWTSSHVNGTTGFSFHIGASSNVMQNTMTYSTGCSVRLIREY